MINWQEGLSQVTENLHTLRHAMQQMDEVGIAIGLFNRLLEGSHLEAFAADEVRAVLCPLQIKVESAIEQARSSI